jgi:hypothetical protein
LHSEKDTGIASPFFTYFFIDTLKSFSYYLQF